jgi:pimeloyl-ACP methyl ester carboxylesterase
LRFTIERLDREQPSCFCTAAGATKFFLSIGIADEATHDEHDLYDGKLSDLMVPTLFIHGSRDPRTEPGELEAMRAQLPHAKIEIIEGGVHSPHSDSSSASESNRVAAEFLASIGRTGSETD